MSKQGAGLAVVVGVMAAYALTNNSVRAQTDPLPFGVGDTVTLRNVAASTPGEWLVDCDVKEIRGIYVKCAPPERIGGSFGARRVETWHSLKFVVEIQKHEK